MSKKCIINFKLNSGRKEPYAAPHLLVPQSARRRAKFPGNRRNEKRIAKESFEGVASFVRQAPAGRATRVSNSLALRAARLTTCERVCKVCKRNRNEETRKRARYQFVRRNGTNEQSESLSPAALAPLLDAYRECRARLAGSRGLTEARHVSEARNSETRREDLWDAAESRIPHESRSHWPRRTSPDDEPRRMS